MQVPHPLLIIHRTLLHRAQHVVIVGLALRKVTSVGVMQRHHCGLPPIATVGIVAGCGAIASSTTVDEVAERARVEPSVNNHTLAARELPSCLTSCPHYLPMVVIRVQNRSLIDKVDIIILSLFIDLYLRLRQLL